MYRSHDHLFKDLIRAFPGELVRLVAPIQVGELSSPSLGFPSTEVFLAPPRGNERRMDLLVRIDAVDGEPLLLHVEIERRFLRATAARLWEYNRLARLRYDLPVYTVVLYLRGGPRGLVAETHRERWRRQEVCRFRYSAFGLSRAPAAAYLRRRNPLAWALAALMHWPGGQAEHQIACLRPIARARHLTEAQRFLLFNVVTTYLNLSGDAVRQYQSMLAERRHRGVRTMIMTWADKMEAKGEEAGLRKGREEGRQEGMKEVVLRLLSRRFSPLPAAVTRKVSALASAEELASLADRILEARSLEDLGLA